MSKAIDVLPVLESPIINSLCPCPIGTKLSTTFIPVSKEVLTGDLAIIEGARASNIFLLTVIIGPLSSIGEPKGQLHDPIKHHQQEYSLIH